MYTTSEWLPPAVEGNKIFIFYHGKIKDNGQLKYVDDAISYGRNLDQLEN